MFQHRILIGAVLVAAFLGGGAHASTVALVVDPSFGSTEDTGAAAMLTLTFSEDNADDLLTVLIENTTDATIGSSLTAFGLELPDVPSLSAAFADEGTGPYFDRLTFDVTVSPGWLNAPGGYDLMVTSDGNFQGGSPQGAPTAGQSETVNLTLGDTGMTPTELAGLFEDFYSTFEGRYAVTRFQAVGPGGERSDMVGGEVPEPATLLLLTLGGIVLGRRQYHR